MNTLKADMYCAERMVLGEGMLWDCAAQRVLWVDIPEGKIYEADEGGTLTRTYSLPDLATTVALGKDGTLIVSGARNVYRINRADGTATDFIALEDVMPNQRLNDGKCDSGGRLIVGSMMLDDGEPTGRLYSVTADGSSRTLLEGIRCSNGIGFSPCGRFVYYIDTPTRAVRRYAHDAATGSLSDEQIVVDTRTYEGMPDGMTTDTNGRLYVAMWGGGAVLCFDPENGELLAKIHLPCARITSCAFGGSALDTLYITTAVDETNPSEIGAGLLYKVSPNAKGFPTYPFG